MVDPLSLAGQRAASLVPFLRDHLQYAQTVILAPRPDLSDFPLKNFYRFVLSPETPEASAVDKDAVGLLHNSYGNGAQAIFDNLPRQHTLTVRVDIPEPWNVQTKTAVQDIDNLRCTSRSCGDPATINDELTSVSYGLKNLLVAGQCFEGALTGAKGAVNYPPNGLQLTLTPANSAVQKLQTSSSYTNTSKSTASASAAVAPAVHTSDTLVMQNLGYFQLQANPGLYVLKLADGKATDLFSISREDASQTPTFPASSSSSSVSAASSTASVQATSKGAGKVIAVRSFGDIVNRLLVYKRRGKEHLSLLDGDGAANEAGSEEGRDGRGGDSGGVWDSLFGSGSSSGSTVGTASLTADADGSSITAANAHPNSAVDDDDDADDDDDDRIHVFSLATGHLYERLLRIMMLSVSRHTSKPVKFWLFENYLSPTFKQLAAAMAEKYGFEVRLLTRIHIL